MGRSSVLVAPGEAAPSRSSLGVSSPAPVLAVIGTTNDLGPELDAALLPALVAAVEAAARAGAVVVTGGTDAGVFHLVRLAMAVSSRTPDGVIGVAPDGLVTADEDSSNRDRVAVDPGLTALVRVKGDQWGDETPMLSRVVAEVATPDRVAVLLVGGGDGTVLEVKEHLRQRRPIVVLRGSGRVADAVAAGTAGDRDDELRSLLAGGDVRVVAVAAGASAVGDELQAILGRRRHRSRRARYPSRRPVLLTVFPKLWFRPPPPAPLLPEEARRDFPQLAERIDEADRYVAPAFAECDQLALREQNRWRWFIVLAIAGGFLTTIFGAVQAWLQSALWPGVVVVTVGAMTTALTTVARRQGSLQQYLAARLRAERLRSLYFEHVARAAETGSAADDTVRRDLERRVAEIHFGKVSV